MYIKKVEITNIRSIDHFEMTFANPAGWHVLIGDNGSGKSSIVRSLALALVGPEQALGLRSDWRDWLSRGAPEGKIHLEISNNKVDKHTGKSARLTNHLIPNTLFFNRNQGGVVNLSSNQNTKIGINPNRFNWGLGTGWFSVAYGPYRRFVGGNPEWTKVYYSQPKLGAHLSAFGEDVALTEATEWLIKLKYKYLEDVHSASSQNIPENSIINHIKSLINSPDFLPHKAEIEDISSEGVVFKDGNGDFISVYQMSDGYRSMLSLTFELIRQMVRVYGEQAVFKNIKSGEVINIDLPGVVIIDEIDAHLHPTWQTRIGGWFTKYFPNIQFIVTTHSPLICRACEKGSIWRLAAPGSEMESGEITGTDRQRLIYGNVLDAYGTDVFGEDVSQSANAGEMLKELADLNLKSFKGIITETDKKRMQELKTILPTE